MACCGGRTIFVSFEKKGGERGRDAHKQTRMSRLKVLCFPSLAMPSAVKTPEFRGILGDCTQLAEDLTDYIRAATTQTPTTRSEVKFVSTVSVAAIT
jgi:hypothetical protein